MVLACHVIIVLVPDTFYLTVPDPASWISDNESSGRQKLPKYRPDVAEGRAVGPSLGIRRVMNKAHRKFLPSRPNLLVIADDYFAKLPAMRPQARHCIWTVQF